MRRPVRGKDVIEGTAQAIGLWPPGYTTDPCPRIRRNIANLGTGGDAELISEEIRRLQQACL